MTEYIVLIPANETERAAKGEAERQAMYGKHRRFAEALAERGHKVTAGAELTPSAEGHTVRGQGGEVRITEGPYAESVEQLSGFYLIESSDYDDLLQCVGILAEGEGALEVRACADNSGGA